MSSYFCCRKKRTIEYENIGEPYSVESSLVSSLVQAGAGKRGTIDDLNLWSHPHDLTHTEAEDDAELISLLEKRDNATTAMAYQMASDQVERIRTNRRKVQDRWKTVLRELGFEDEKEVSKLVTVTPLSNEAMGTSHFSMQADSLHSALVRDTMIFGNGSTQRDRYATVLSRFIDLDTAEDFVEKARELYPRIDPDTCLPDQVRVHRHSSNSKHFSRPDLNQNTNQPHGQVNNVEQNHRVHYDKSREQDYLQIVFDTSDTGEIERE